MQYFNDVSININSEDQNARNILRNLQADLEEILTLEFRHKVPDFQFLQIVQNHGYYEKQKNPLIISYTIQNELGETLRDPEDIIKHYYKQQGINLVSAKEWQKDTSSIQQHSFDNEGNFQEDLYNHLVDETIEKYEQEGKTLFWKTKDIKPVELEEAISNTIKALQWVIHEYIKDNPELQVIYRGPYEATFKDLEEDNIDWGKKYPHMQSLTSLIEVKDKATIQQGVKNGL